MKGLICSALFALSFLGLSSCIPFRKSPPLLQVGDETWTSKKFVKEVEFYLENFKDSPESPGKEEEIKKRVAEELVLKSLVEAWARRNKVKLLQEEKAKPSEELPLFYSSSPKIFKKSFRERALFKELLSHLRRKGRRVEKKEKLLFYKKNRSLFYKKKACWLEQILVSSKEKALFLRKKLLEGESFEKLAKNHSLAPERKRAGSLGWVEEKTFPLFDRACRLALKEIGPVLKSPYGFHLLRVLKKRKGFFLSFKQAEGEISEILEQDHLQISFKAWLEEEFKNTPFFIDENLLAQIRIHYRRK